MWGPSDPPQGPHITEDALFSSIRSSRADLHFFSIQLTSLLCCLRHPCETVSSDERVQIRFAHWFDTFMLTWPLARFSKNEWTGSLMLTPALPQPRQTSRTEVPYIAQAVSEPTRNLSPPPSGACFPETETNMAFCVVLTFSWEKKEPMSSEMSQKTQMPLLIVTKKKKTLRK